MTFLWLLAILFSPGYCEERIEEKLIESLDISEISEMGEAHGIDIRKILISLVSGDDEALFLDTAAIRETAGEYLTGNLLKILSALAVPITMSIPVGIFMRKAGEGAGIFNLICRISCVGVICAAFAELAAAADEITGLADQCTRSMTPLIVSAYALSGQENAGGAVSAVSSIASGLIQEGIGKWGRILALAALGASVAGNLTEKISLKRLHSMICEIFQWGTGLVMVGYMGMLSLRGKLAAVQDGAGIRAVRYTIESVIPVIGGNVSDSLGSLLLTAGLVRSALGVIGVILIVAISVLPMIRMAGIMLALRFASAACEPLGDSSMSAMLGQSADAAKILLVASMSVCLICALLSGSCISALNIAK